MLRPLHAARAGAAAERGGIQFVEVGRIDHSDDRLAAVLQGDRDREDRQPLTVVGRAVERVDDPQPFAVCIAARAALLAQHGVVGETLRDHADDERLALAVGARYHVADVRLGADRQVAAAEVGQMDLPRFARHAHGQFQILLVHSALLRLFALGEILVEPRNGLHAAVELLEPEALVRRVDRILGQSEADQQ